MNELKSVYIDRTGDWVRSGTNTGNFCLKPEADKVIAHQKYRRCLAMAKWCRFLTNYWECCEPFDCSKFIAKANFFRKWRNRWLKIARKYK